MYPEASYSFDGTQTPLPESLAKCMKLLKVPVVMIRTEGAFLRDPLYNCLQKRKVGVHARMEYLLSPDEIEQKSVKEIDAVLRGAFCYDHFREQQEKRIEVKETSRADGLHRVFYTAVRIARKKAACVARERRSYAKSVGIHTN